MPDETGAPTEQEVLASFAQDTSPEDNRVSRIRHLLGAAAGGFAASILGPTAGAARLVGNDEDARKLDEINKRYQGPLGIEPTNPTMEHDFSTGLARAAGSAPVTLLTAEGGLPALVGTGAVSGYGAYKAAKEDYDARAAAGELLPDEQPPSPYKEIAKGAASNAAFVAGGGAGAALARRFLPALEGTLPRVATAYGANVGGNLAGSAAARTLETGSPAYESPAAMGEDFGTAFGTFGPGPTKHLLADPRAKFGYKPPAKPTAAPGAPLTPTNVIPELSLSPLSQATVNGPEPTPRGPTIGEAMQKPVRLGPDQNEPWVLREAVRRGEMEVTDIPESQGGGRLYTPVKNFIQPVAPTALPALPTEGLVRNETTPEGQPPAPTLPTNETRNETQLQPQLQLGNGPDGGVDQTINPGQLVRGQSGQRPGSEVGPLQEPNGNQPGGEAQDSVAGLRGQSELGPGAAQRPVLAPVPESPQTLIEQQKQLVAGQRPAMLFTPGEVPLDLPPGLSSVQTKSGLVHFNPELTTALKVKEAVEAGRENEILGLGPENKADVVAAGGKPVVVTERTPDGVEVKAAASSPGKVEETKAALEQGKTEGNVVAEEAPESVLAARRNQTAIEGLHAQIGALDEQLAQARRVGFIDGKPAPGPEAAAARDALPDLTAKREDLSNDLMNFTPESEGEHEPLTARQQAHADKAADYGSKLEEARQKLAAQQAVVDSMRPENAKKGVDENGNTVEDLGGLSPEQRAEFNEAKAEAASLRKAVEFLQQKMREHEQMEPPQIIGAPQGKADLSEQIDKGLASPRGEFNLTVRRKTKYGEDTLRFTAGPHGNPAIKETQYNVHVVKSDTGRDFDANVNKGFDSREKFIEAIRRYQRDEPPQIIGAPKQLELSEPERKLKEQGFYSRLSKLVDKLPDALAEIPGKTVPGREILAKEIRNPKTGELIKKIEAGKEPDKVYPATSVVEQFQKLAKEGKVGEDELKWSGIIPWLKAQGPTVTRDQIREYIREHGSVKVEEKYFGHDPRKAAKPGEMTEFQKHRAEVLKQAERQVADAQDEVDKQVKASQKYDNEVFRPAQKAVFDLIDDYPPQDVLPPEEFKKRYDAWKAAEKGREPFITARNNAVFQRRLARKNVMRVQDGKRSATINELVEHDQARAKIDKQYRDGMLTADERDQRLFEADAKITLDPRVWEAGQKLEAANDHVGDTGNALRDAVRASLEEGGLGKGTESGKPFSPEVIDAYVRTLRLGDPEDLDRTTSHLAPTELAAHIKALKAVDDAIEAKIQASHKAALETPLPDEGPEPTTYGGHMKPFAPGKNYRELIVTMPAPKAPPGETGLSVRRATKEEVRQLKVNYADRPWWAVQRKDGTVENLYEYEHEANNRKKDLENPRPQRDTAAYHAPHFGGEDIVFNVLVDDRTDTKGRDVAFIQESQTDRHKDAANLAREAKKKGVEISGYREERPDDAKIREVSQKRDDALAERKEARDKAAAEVKEYGDLGFDNTRQALEAVLTHDDYADRWDLAGPEHADARAALDDFRIKFRAAERAEAAYAQISQRSGIPDAPYRTTSFLESVKRILRDTVHTGGKYVGWNVGDTLNERYNLIQAVKRISWVHHEPVGTLSGKINGRIEVEIHPHNGGKMTLTVKPDGEITSGTVRGKSVKGETLAGILGNGAMAEKILKSDVNTEGTKLRDAHDAAKAESSRALGKYHSTVEDYYDAAKDQKATRAIPGREAESDAAFKEYLAASDREAEAGKVYREFKSRPEKAAKEAARAQNIYDQAKADHEADIKALDEARTERQVLENQGASADPKKVKAAKDLLEERSAKRYDSAHALDEAGRKLVEANQAKQEAESRYNEISTPEDFNIGGEGKRRLYDKKAVQDVGDYIAQWGGKMEKGEMPTRRTERFAEDQRDAYVEHGPIETRPYHLFEITPEMERAVREEGQPIAAPKAVEDMAKRYKVEPEKVQAFVDKAEAKDLPKFEAQVRQLFGEGVEIVRNSDKTETIGVVPTRDGGVEIHVGPNYVARTGAKFGEGGGAHLAKTLGEEAIHVAVLRAIKEMWQKAGAQGDFYVYTKAVMSRISNDILGTVKGLRDEGKHKEAHAIEEAIRNSKELYDGELENANSLTGRQILEQMAKDPTLAFKYGNELLRQFAQLRQNKQITETTYQRIARALTDLYRRAQQSLRNVVGKAHGGELGKTAGEVLRRTEELLQGEKPRGKRVGEMRAEREIYRQGATHLEDNVIPWHGGADEQDTRTSSRELGGYSPRAAASDYLEGSRTASEGSLEPHERHTVELARLANFEAGRGRLVDRAALVDGNPDVEGGGEHQVLLEPASQRWVKFTRPGSAGVVSQKFETQIPLPENISRLSTRGASPSEYFERMRLSNEKLEDNQQYHGVWLDKDGEPGGLVISQPHVEGTESTRGEISRTLTDKGFKRVGIDTWYRPSDRVMLDDTTPRNFVTKDGVAVPIDVPIRVADDALHAEAMRQIDSGQKFLKAGERKNLPFPPQPDNRQVIGAPRFVEKAAKTVEEKTREFRYLWGKSHRHFKDSFFRAADVIDTTGNNAGAKTQDRIYVTLSRAGGGKHEKVAEPSKELKAAAEEAFPLREAGFGDATSREEIDAAKDKLQEFRTRIERGLVSPDPDVKTAAEALKPIYDRAAELVDKDLGQALARALTVAQETNRQLADAATNGIDIEGVDNYIRRVYSQDLSKDPDAYIPSAGGKGGPRYDKGFLKPRAYESAVEAMENGKKVANFDVAQLVGQGEASLQKLIGEKRLNEELRSVAAPVTGKPVMANGIKAWNPRLREFVEYAPDGYRKVEGPGGKPIYVEQNVAPLFNLLASPSWLRGFAGGRLALKVAAGIKHGTLLFDSYHLGRQTANLFGLLAQGGSPAEIKRFITRGLSTLDVDPTSLDHYVKEGHITEADKAYVLKNQERYKLAEASGVNFGKQLDNLYEQIGHPFWVSILNKIPKPGGGGAGDYITDFNKYVFQKSARAAMLVGFNESFERNQKRFPNKTQEEVGRLTAREINETFGNMGRQGIFKSKTAQDISRLFVLAPQWNDARWRFQGRAVGQLGKAAGKLLSGNPEAIGNAGGTLLALAAGAFAANQVINLATRGQPTWDNEDGHKLDAWIPGGKNGFFYSPLNLAAEDIHTAMKYGEKGSPLDAAKRIALNKSSGVTKAAAALAGIDPLGRPMPGDLNRVAQAGKSLLPIPIFASPLTTPTLQPELAQKGDLQRQAFGMVGIKLDRAESPEQRLRALANKTQPKQFPKIESPGDYSRLRSFVTDENLKNAKEEILGLVSKGKTEEQIRTAFKPSRTYTTSKGADLLLMRQPGARELLQPAQQDRVASANFIAQAIAAAKRDPRYVQNVMAARELKRPNP